MSLSHILRPIEINGLEIKNRIVRADQIEDIVDAFARTAVRARDGELDGVEVHFGHGYLIQPGGDSAAPATCWSPSAKDTWSLACPKKKHS